MTRNCPQPHFLQRRPRSPNRSFTSVRESSVACLLSLRCRLPYLAGVLAGRTFRLGFPNRDQDAADRSVSSAPPAHAVLKLFNPRKGTEPFSRNFRKSTSA